MLQKTVLFWYCIKLGTYNVNFKYTSTFFSSVHDRSWIWRLDEMSKVYKGCLKMWDILYFYWIQNITFDDDDGSGGVFYNSGAVYCVDGIRYYRVGVRIWYEVLCVIINNNICNIQLIYVYYIILYYMCVCVLCAWQITRWLIFDETELDIGILYTDVYTKRFRWRGVALSGSG